MKDPLKYYHFVWEGLLLKALRLPSSDLSCFLKKWDDEDLSDESDFWTEDPLWYVIPFAASRLAGTELSSRESIAIEKIISEELKIDLQTYSYTIPSSYNWEHLGARIFSRL